MIKIKFMRTKNLKGAVKAFFSADLGTLSIEDMKLVEGSNGRFLGFPSRSYEAQGETKYSDIVRLARDANGKFTSAAQNLYDQILAAAETEYEKQSNGVPASTQSEDDLNDLPF